MDKGELKERPNCLFQPDSWVNFDDYVSKVIAVCPCYYEPFHSLVLDASDPIRYSGFDGYYDADQCLAVAEASEIKGFADLKGKDLAVKTGTMSAEYAESMVDEYGFSIVYFEDSPTMYQAVVGGQVAGVIDDTPIMAANIKDGGLAMKLVDGTGNDPAEYGLAVFSADNQELVDLFNAGLKNIKENGVYEEILAKYLG